MIGFEPSPDPTTREVVLELVVRSRIVHRPDAEDAAVSETPWDDCDGLSPHGKSWIVRGTLGVPRLVARHVFPTMRGRAGAAESAA